MEQDYSELLKRADIADWLPNVKELATAIRALVAENERLELALKTIVELPISDSSQDDMSAANMRTIARAALGETK